MRRLPLGLVAMTCFAVGFAGTLVWPDADREAIAAPPAPSQAAQITFASVFRAEVNDLCREHTEWAADNGGQWRSVTTAEVRRLQVSASRLRLDGLRDVYPASRRDRATLRRMRDSLSQVEYLADDAAHAGGDGVVDEMFREDVMLELEGSLRSLSGLVEARGLPECALS